MDLLLHLLTCLEDIAFKRFPDGFKYACYIRGWPGYGETPVEAFYDSLDSFLEAHPNEMLEM